MTGEWHSDLSERETSGQHNDGTFLNRGPHNAVKLNIALNSSVFPASVSLFVNWSGFVFVTLTTHSLHSFPIKLSPDTGMVH